MSQSNSFASGFFLGALIGGIAGGVAGVLAAQRSRHTGDRLAQLTDEISQNLADMSHDERMEVARRGLEDKISALNSAIEDVRQQLGNSNGHATDYEASVPDA